MEAAHGNFYVVVATAIPVLYVVVAFQATTLDRPFWAQVVNSRSLPEWYRRWVKRSQGFRWNSGLLWFVRATYLLIPMSAVLVSASALKDDSDRDWKRTWGWLGFFVAVFYTLSAIAAATVTMNATQEETPTARTGAG
jgi:hypothetical protein